MNKSFIKKMSAMALVSLMILSQGLTCLAVTYNVSAPVCTRTSVSAGYKRTITGGCSYSSGGSGSTYVFNRVYAEYYIGTDTNKAYPMYTEKTAGYGYNASSASSVTTYATYYDFDYAHNEAGFANGGSIFGTNKSAIN
ncbi:MAG: hypothetical protein J6L69_06930 [Lachnospiraceae bacterium]|nr:hypothetical protein [Lachnospiraceae bacterium]